VPRGPRGLDPNGGPTGLGLAPTAGVAAATAGGGAPGAAGAAAAAAAYARGAMAARGGAAEHGLGDEEGGAHGGERAGTPEDAALARKFLNTTSPALPKARPGRRRPASALTAKKSLFARGCAAWEPAWRPPWGAHTGRVPRWLSFGTACDARGTPASSVLDLLSASVVPRGAASSQEHGKPASLVPPWSKL